jgi:hypothetical protein
LSLGLDLPFTVVVKEMAAFGDIDFFYPAQLFWTHVLDAYHACSPAAVLYNVAVINTITSPKRAFMRQESKLAKLCVNLSIKD